jgi:hypothetical protein
VFEDGKGVVWSRELCGGRMSKTRKRRNLWSPDQKEESSSAGVRRIKALLEG